MGWRGLQRFNADRVYTGRFCVQNESVRWVHVRAVAVQKTFHRVPTLQVRDGHTLRIACAFPLAFCRACLSVNMPYGCSVALFVRVCMLHRSFNIIDVNWKDNVRLILVNFVYVLSR